MANLGTMEQEIFETLHSLASKTKIRHRIINSIGFHHEKRYFFSERTFRFTLTPGRGIYRPGDGYGLPDDLVEIIGPDIWLTPEGTSQPTPLDRINMSQMDWDLAYEAGTPAEPESWDWFGGGLRLTPIPDDADTIEGPYVRDIGVPKKKYDVSGATWSFYTPDGANTLGDDYTSHWFDPLGGYSLIKHRALHLCFKEILHDEARSAEELTTWLEERNRLEDETEGKTGPSEIPPTFW